MTDERRDEVERLLRGLASWAAGTTDVRAIGLVGSWARNQPRMDSDLDVVVLTDDPAAYVETEAWIISAIGQAGLSVKTRQWGVVTERRVRLSSGFEVEFGFAKVTWAATTPCDAGTVDVVRNGLVPLFDPANLLQDLLDAVA